MIDPAAWGLLPGHHDIGGSWHPASERGVRAALDAMGAARDGPPDTTTWVVRQEQGCNVQWPGRLVTEDGGSRSVVPGYVSDLPLGYHVLHPDDGPPIRLVVSPRACPLPPRTWGWAVQLYAARSRDSCGIGDLEDLRRVASWGAGVLLINPLHAVAPTLPQEPSPYSPASRRWRNPIYLRVPGTSLPSAGLIDRDQVWTVKRAALSSLFAESADLSDLAAFEAWAAGQGDALTGFATWAALADAHGPDWRLWPLELRQHDSVAVASWRSAHADEVAFHAWLQWQIEQQLSVAASAGSAVGSALVTDLAIGADPGGADTWVWPSVFAEGVTVGAPPDGFSPDGQDWGLPPFDPWRLRAAGYDPFIQIVRAALSTGGGVRIDHVIGLFRSFWVPDGLSPAEGVYVRYPWEDLINIVALEAHRAGAFVIGEDLGTVEPWVRSELASRNILSYRLLCFEDDPPTSWPELALAAVSTHDLPTIEGVLTGADDDARRIVGLTVDDQASAQMRARLCDAGESTERIYEALAASPALLAVASLEDALGVTKRPNHPGSVNEWPNWRIPLPLALEEIETDPRVANLSRVLAGYDRSAISGGI